MSGLTERTPLFNALQSERYGRRSDIQDIEGITGRKLIVYFAKPGAGIEQDDVLAFGDLLHDVSGQSIDLLLQSPGGDIDVAEKLVSLTASRCPSFRVIVAQSAKSAATLMALASDEIVMGDTSELGPIDPQVTVTTAQGQRMARPASSFLDGLELIKRQVDDEGGELSPGLLPASRKSRPRRSSTTARKPLRGRSASRRSGCFVLSARTKIRPGRSRSDWRTPRSIFPTEP